MDFGLSKIVTANESLSADSKSEVPEIVSSGTIDMLRKIIPLKVWMCLTLMAVVWGDGLVW